MTGFPDRPIRVVVTSLMDVVTSGDNMYLSEGHLRNDGEHDLLGLGRVRVAAVVGEPDLKEHINVSEVSPSIGA